MKAQLGKRVYISGNPWTEWEVIEIGEYVKLKKVEGIGIGEVHNVSFQDFDKHWKDA